MDATALPGTKREAATPPLPQSVPLLGHQQDGDPPEYLLIEEWLRDTPTGGLHLGRDKRTSEEVLIKLVSLATFPSPMLLERTLRELRQLRQLRQLRMQGQRDLRGVMQVVGCGRTGLKELFVAFRPPPAGAILLDERVARFGPLEVDRGRRVVIQIGEALFAAQQVGVLHRNLAPFSIFIDASDEILVTDFALAEFHEVSWRMVQGAPHFLSPEQAEGRTGDQRSTIYSLGALFYYLITGAPPFAGGDVAEVLGRVVSMAPEPPGRRVQGLHVEVDQVICSALAKDPQGRVPTLRLFLDELVHLGDVLAEARRERPGWFLPALSDIPGEEEIDEGDVLSVTWLPAEPDLVAEHGLAGPPPDADLHSRPTIPLSVLGHKIRP